MSIHRAAIGVVSIALGSLVDASVSGPSAPRVGVSEQVQAWEKKIDTPEFFDREVALNHPISKRYNTDPIWGALVPPGRWDYFAFFSIDAATAESFDQIDDRMEDLHKTIGSILLKHKEKQVLHQQWAEQYFLRFKELFHRKLREFRRAEAAWLKQDRLGQRPYFYINQELLHVNIAQHMQKQALKAYPTLPPQAWGLFAYAQLQWLSDGGEALYYLSKLHTSYPYFEGGEQAEVMVGDIAIEQGHMARATQAFEHLVTSQDPQIHTYALYKLAWTYLLDEEHPQKRLKAMDLLKEAILAARLQKPGVLWAEHLQKEALWDLIRLFGKNPQTDHAEAFFHQIQAPEYLAFLWERLAYKYVKQGNLTSAAHLYENLLTLTPERPSNPYQSRKLAKIYLHQQDWEGLKTVLTQAHAAYLLHEGPWAHVQSEEIKAQAKTIALDLFRVYPRAAYERARSSQGEEIQRILELARGVWQAQGDTLQLRQTQGQLAQVLALNKNYTDALDIYIQLILSSEGVPQKDVEALARQALESLRQAQATAQAAHLTPLGPEDTLGMHLYQALALHVPGGLPLDMKVIARPLWIRLGRAQVGAGAYEEGRNILWALDLKDHLPEEALALSELFAAQTQLLERPGPLQSKALTWMGEWQTRYPKHPLGGEALAAQFRFFWGQEAWIQAMHVGAVMVHQYPKGRSVSWVLERLQEVYHQAGLYEEAGYWQLLLGHTQPTLATEGFKTKLLESARDYYDLGKGESAAKAYRMWLQRYGTDPLVGEVYIAYIESRMLAGESPLEDLRAFLKTPQADRLDEMTRLHAALLETHMTQHGWDEVLTRIRLTPEPLPEAVQQALWRGRPDKIPESLRQPIDVPALEDLHGLWQKHPSDASTFVWPSYESFLTSMGMAEGGPP